MRSEANCRAGDGNGVGDSATDSPRNEHFPAAPANADRTSLGVDFEQDGRRIARLFPMPMSPSRIVLALVLAGWGSAASAQSEVSLSEPRPSPVVGRFLAPFHIQKRIVPPVRLTDSPR